MNLRQDFHDLHDKQDINNKLLVRSSATVV